jgi:1-acyl-sn-glycerol-3-phosphate acyltransferase
MSKKTDPIVDIDRPSPKAVARLFAAMRVYFAPVFYGMDNIDTKTPYMFVGNHTVNGVFDVPLLFSELYQTKGIFLRGMSDNLHYSIPLWRNFLTRLGAVKGTRENVKKLMKARENILLFPGGGREVFKLKGEAYKLIWKERLGFARLAVEQSYSILPFASVGVENAFSIVFDRNDLMKSFLGKIIKQTGILKDAALKDGENIPPITRGLGLTMFPRPERLYFSFGEPIDTTPFKGNHEDKETLFTVRKMVANSIESQIEELLQRRKQDPDVGIFRRFLTRL